MKNALILVGIVIVLVGCSKGEAGGELQTQGGAPKSSSPNVGTNDAVDPNSVVARPHSGSSSISPASQPEKRNPPATGRIHSGPRQFAAPEQPKDNPAAAPPHQGEKVAVDYRIEMGQRTVEIEGVCKLTEDEAVCWKPNGEKNETLATELTSAIKAKTDTYSSTFQFKFLKKNRILVLKTTTKPIRSANGAQSYNYGLLNQYRGGSEAVEGWTTGNNTFGSSNGTGFDQTQVERQVLVGSFNKETKAFPLRYQFTSSIPDRKVIPFTKGQFTFDGNSYEIVSISDKPEPGSQPNNMYMGSNRPGAKPQKMTYVKIQVVSISNPDTILNLVPADDTGLPYAGLNDKGEPISQAEMQKLRDEANRKMMEDQKAGRPYEYSKTMRMTSNYIQQIMLDPGFSYGVAQSKGLFNVAINVEVSKIKKLSVTISNRTVFVFDKIKLDPN
jgi:hypothetical protein